MRKYEREHAVEERKEGSIVNQKKTTQKRGRSGVVSAVAGQVRTEQHDVFVAFGGEIEDENEDSMKEASEGIESRLWVFVTVSKRQVQFLQRCDDESGLWELTKQTGDRDMEIRKTWAGVKFNLTGTGKNARTTTATPFPADDWEALRQEAQAFFERSEMNMTGEG
jgi:trehalose-6-phosphate synthase